MDLQYERKNVYKVSDKAQTEKIYAFSEDYKQFLNNSKTERDASRTAKKLAEENGYTPFSFSEKLKKGDKRYFINRDKNIFLISVGSEDISTDGIRIMV
ncbi:MAG: aminopeptidase, partial [Clostridia bacterium]|nr:aminopeptidase [Clostridia bacterium]